MGNTHLDFKSISKIFFENLILIRKVKIFFIHENNEKTCVIMNPYSNPLLFV